MALSVLTACTLLALAMSHTMVLQHHYGQHLFGDDLAQGARVYVRVHRRHGHGPFARVQKRVSRLTGEVEAEFASVEKAVAQRLDLPHMLAGAQGPARQSAEVSCCGTHRIPA